MKSYEESEGSPTPEQSVIDAAKAGDEARLRVLLDGDPGLANARGWRGITPLIEAASNADSVVVVRLLLERGADPLAVWSDGYTALHRAVGGEVAELLVAAAGVPGLRARDRWGRTPLYSAVDHGHAEVVRVLLAAGSDPSVLVEDAPGSDGPISPLDVAKDPVIVGLLLAAGASVHTPRKWTPLHLACARIVRDGDWPAVVDLLLDHGADPGRRTEFGDSPLDILGVDGDAGLRARMTGILHGTGRSTELGLADVAAGEQRQVAIHPTRDRALTSMYLGAVLVEWRLTPAVEPVGIVRSPVRAATKGPYGSVGETMAFTDHRSVHLRSWQDLTESIPVELPRDRSVSRVCWSPDGRLLAVTGAEALRLIDVQRREVVADTAELDDVGLGDWSAEPQFSPDGRLLAIGNSMQGVWWQTVLDVSPEGALRLRYDRESDKGQAPTNPRTSEIVTAVAFSPDGRRTATWVRPDFGIHLPNGYRGLVAVAWAADGESDWYQSIDDEMTGVPGDSSSAALCFTADGAQLAVGLDSGVVWFDTETGAHLGTSAIGTVLDLACAPHVGMLAATSNGLLRIQPPTR